MTFVGAAKAVLQGADRPLTSREICERALKNGLLTTKGKTPEASMSAALYGLAANDPAGNVQRIYEDGTTRARRGSVRWIWRG